MTARLCTTLGICAAALVSGCGEEQPQTTARPRLRPARTAGTPDVPVRAARTTPPQAAPEIEDSKPAAPWTRTTPAFDPEADPDDLFAVVDGPNFEIAATRGEPHPDDLFSGAVPEAGVSSSSFVVVEPGPGQTEHQPRPGFSLPAGFEVVAAAGYTSEGLPRRLVCRADGAAMVLVPAGVSLLGTDDGPSEATPQLEVSLDDFYIDVTEVTLEQHGRYLRARRSQTSRSLEEPLNNGAPGKHPVLGLSWGAARDYAQWAGKELPTESQWEKAARGPTGFAHPWGDGRTVFARARTLSQIDPVGSFPLDRSPCRALDMAGNAREWCLDFFSNRAFADAAALGQSPLANWQGPRRPSANSQRVVKGNGPDWTVWHREGLSMSARRADVGFRCVLQLRSAGEPAD